MPSPPDPYQVCFHLQAVDTRSSAAAEGPREHAVPVSGNLVDCSANPFEKCHLKKLAIGARPSRPFMVIGTDADR